MKVGLLGAGTIGYGVIELAEKVRGIEIKKVLDRRDIPGLEGRITRNIDDILGDSEIEAVVELLGGVEPARTWARMAMEAGKHFVTANKLMISENFAETQETARDNNVVMRFSAAVGGGIPYILNLVRARRADRIFEVGGILNGTTNYMLDLMLNQSIGFNAALKLAQDAGYAERDPSADLSGGDAKSKIMITASMAFDAIINKSDILCEGIQAVNAEDMAWAKEKGYGIKLMARAARVDDGICCYVEPTLVRQDTVTANIALVENMAYFISENAGLQRFTGAGAGRYPTAYAVINDLMDIRDNRDSYVYAVSGNSLVIDNSAERHAYMVRGIDSPDCRIISKTSVSQMHDMARNAREAGNNVFFAGIID